MVSQPPGSLAPCILVVEDSVLVAMAVEAVLLDRGYDVIVAGSLAAATERLQRGPVAAALLDVHLPDGSTLDLAHVLTARNCPVAVCSGMDSESVPNGYPQTARFDKPIEPERLADWVDSVLRGSPEAPTG